MREKKPNDLEKAHNVPHSECLLFPSLLYIRFAPILACLQIPAVLMAARWNLAIGCLISSTVTT